MRSAKLILATLFLASLAQAEADLKFSGFVIPSWVGATHGVDSFSQPNMSAYTAAGNPAMATQGDSFRSSFQAAQSRLGISFSPETTSKGSLEFDFIDFAKASPTTGAMPRVRRAVVELFQGDFTFRFGQDWDLVSPLAPFSYNYVGHYFESGDIGFMRLQAQAIWKHGNQEQAIAVGLPGNNNTAADGAVELTLLPTFAARQTWNLAQMQLGASLLATWIRLAKTSPERALAGAATLFAQSASGATLEWRAEAYLGQNTFNLGMLGLAFGGSAAPEIREAGAYISSKYHVSSTFSVFGGIGGAWVLNPSGMYSSYARTGGVATLASTGPGLEWNATLRLGVDWTLGKNAVLFAEGAGLLSRHHLLAGDALEPGAATFVTQVGTQLSL